MGEEHYWYSDKPTFIALWDNYNQCQFVEDKGKPDCFPQGLMSSEVNYSGSVLFYRNKKGQAVRKAAPEFEN